MHNRQERLNEGIFGNSRKDLYCMTYGTFISFMFTFYLIFFKNWNDFCQEGRDIRTLSEMAMKQLLTFEMAMKQLLTFLQC